jgi:hypothetical protein
VDFSLHLYFKEGLRSVFSICPSILPPSSGFSFQNCGHGRCIEPRK